MRRFLSLGIQKPFLRMFVWLSGCAFVSALLALLGPVIALPIVALVLLSTLLGRITT